MKVPAGDVPRIPVAELGARYDWEIGKSKLTLYFHMPPALWRGIIRQPNKADLHFRGDDRDDVVSEMERETAKPAPKIVGFSEARSRFLYIYPGGFTNPSFEAGERGGKTKAGAVLQPLRDDGLPPEDAFALLKAARKILDRGGQSPLHMTESSDLDAIWKSGDGPLYVRGVRAWAAGDRQEAFKLIHRACQKRRASWPMFTLYPALLTPAANAILRPTATKTFALAVKSVFGGLYDSEPSEIVYRAYLDLLDQTGQSVADLAPRDYIDLASFVWVSTSYGGDTQPRL